MLDATQVRQIVKYILSQVPHEDLPQLSKFLPQVLEEEYRKTQPVEKQPKSVLRHYLNWAEYANNHGNTVMFGVLFIMIWIGIVLAVIFPPLTFGVVINLRAVMVILIDTVVMLGTPVSIRYFRWHRWYVKHPINLHASWHIADYRN